MIQNYNPDNFPFDSLPNLLKNLIHEIAYNVQVPYAMVTSSVFGVMSIATQRYADVKRPNGLTSPISLFTFTIAESGDRKSTVDRLLTKSIIAFEDNQRSKYKFELESYKASEAIWDIKHKSILREIKKTYTQGAVTDHLSAQLTQHLLAKPQPPAIKKTLIKDVTPEAMIQSMSAHGASLGLFSDEAVSVIAGRAMSDIGQFNKLWEGSDIVKSRVSTGETIVKDPRLTCCLMSQRKVFQEFVERNDGEVRQVGLLARFLISSPVSFQGFRETTGHEQEWKHLDLFHEIVSYFLNTHSHWEQNLVIEFDQFAKLKWLEACNLIESHQQLSGMYFDVKDFASKFGENVARVAALIELVTEKESLIISENSMLAAIQICDWYLVQAKNLLAKPIYQLTLDNQDKTDAIDLYKYFIDYVNSHHGCLYQYAIDYRKCFDQNWYSNQISLQLTKNKVYQLGPNRLRGNKTRFNRALDQLIRCGVVIQSDLNTGKKSTAYLNFYPNRLFNLSSF